MKDFFCKIVTLLTFASLRTLDFMNITPVFQHDTSNPSDVLILFLAHSPCMWMGNNFIFY